MKIRHFPENILSFLVLAFGLLIVLGSIGCSKDKTPHIYDLIAPDSLQKGSPDTSYIYIKARDPQGLNNIDSVYFSVIKPDGTTSGLHFYLLDDGQGGDLLIGDGIFTKGIQAPTLSNQTGNYTFRFIAKDRDGHKSNIIDKTILAYEWPYPVISRSTINQYDALRQHIFVAARVLDIPTQANIDTVWVEINYQDSSRAIGTFLLNDDGSYGDSSAADLRYSVDIFSPDELFSPGNYQIIFKAVDLNGHRAVPVEKVILVEPPSRIK